jgi:hypothetical protein
MAARTLRGWWARLEQTRRRPQHEDKGQPAFPCSAWFAKKQAALHALLPSIAVPQSAIIMTAPGPGGLDAARADGGHLNGRRPGEGRRLGPAGPAGNGPRRSRLDAAGLLAVTSVAGGTMQAWPARRRPGTTAGPGRDTAGPGLWARTCGDSADAWERRGGCGRQWEEAGPPPLTSRMRREGLVYARARGSRLTSPPYRGVAPVAAGSQSAAGSPTRRGSGRECSGAHLGACSGRGGVQRAPVACRPVHSVRSAGARRRGRAGWW